MHTYIHTGIHAYMHTGIQAYRHTDIQTYRQTDRQTYMQRGRQIYRHAEKGANGRRRDPRKKEEGRKPVRRNVQAGTLK